jgi:NAD(P)-dependent dehydrogenase (short-subunit alcohol dehydrogenase family)
VEDVLGYEGRHAVVTGAASGMGAATAELLTALGAQVTALDVQNVALPVSASHHLDLTDRASIDAVVAQIDGPVDAVFSVAGLPGPPHSDLDTVTVNFIGARHLIESLVPLMPEGAAVTTVASNAGLGWQEDLDALLPLVTTAGFDEARDWCRAHPEAIASGYLPSKKFVNAWVAWRSAALLSERGIRLNCTNPGPTDTAMMPTFEEQAGKELIDAFLGPSGRRSTAEEQAWPLLFLNSPRAAYISGEALHVDAGFLGAMTTGQLEV